MVNNGADVVKATEQTQDFSGVVEQVAQAQRAGAWPQAIALLQKAIGRDYPPETMAQIWNSLGYSYVMNDRLFEAEMALQRGLKLAPENLDLLGNLADLYLRREDYVQATQYLKQALQVDAGDVGVLLAFGNCAIQLGDLEAALLAFERVKSIAPETEGIDDILRQLHGPEEAMPESGPAVATGPEPALPATTDTAADPLLATGQAALDRGDFETAAREFAWLTAQHPNLAEAHAALGSAFLALDNPEAAMPALRRAVELAPNAAKNYHQLGVALYQVGQENDAEAAFLEGLEREPDQPALLNGLAQLYFQQGRLDQATDYLNRVLRRDVDNLEALQLLGHCAIQLEAFDVALMAFYRVQTLAPETEGIDALLAELAAVVPEAEQPQQAAPVESTNGRGNGAVSKMTPLPKRDDSVIDLTPSQPAPADLLPDAWDWDAPPDLTRKPAAPDCTIVIPADHKPDLLPSCLETVQQHAPAAASISVQVINPPPHLPPTSQPFEAVSDTNLMTALTTALDEAAARYVLLLSPDVRGTAGWLDQMIAIAEAEATIAAVGPVANTAPSVQQIEAGYHDVEAGLAHFASQRTATHAGQWQPVPHLGGFCLLLRTHAVQVVGGLAKEQPLAEALLDLYDRLQRYGFKLACAQGVYVHHQTLSEAEGASYDQRTDPEAQLQQLLQPGQTAIERDDLETAAREFAAVVRQHPDLAAGHTALGSTLLALDRVDEAVPSLRRAAELVPQLAAAHNQLGTALYRLGRQNEAEAAFKQAQQADPNDLEALHNLAELDREQHRHPEALTAHEQVLRKEPQQPDAIVTFGLISLAVGNRAQAAHALANLEDAPPDHPGVRAFREAMGQATPQTVDTRAARAARAARDETPAQNSPVEPQISPDEAKEQMELAMAVGEAAIKLGNFELADREFRRVIQKHPDLAAAHAALGGVLLTLDRADEAIAPLRRAIELVPEVAANHNQLGIALFRAGQFAEAEAAFNRARELDPDDVEPLLNLVDLYRNQQRYQEAIEATKTALALDESNPDVLVTFGILCYELGDTEGAQMAWAQLQSAPADHPGVEALGRLLNEVQASL